MDRQTGLKRYYASIKKLHRTCVKCLCKGRGELFLTILINLILINIDLILYTQKNINIFKPSSQTKTKYFLIMR